jgi:hypothetical protein
VGAVSAAAGAGAESRAMIFDVILATNRYLSIC